MEWTSAYIRVWFFPRGAIPPSASTYSPNVTEFGEPVALFQGSCNIDDHFAMHNIIFNIDFCGDYAGNAYDNTTCPGTPGLSNWDQCVNWVGDHPQNFTDAYWQVNSLRVFQQISGPTSTSSSSISSITPTVSPSGGGVAMGNLTTATSSPTLSLASTSTSSQTAASTYSACPPARASTGYPELRAVY